MNAVVLAGGMGTRLRPYTVSLPKPLMPVGDQPILQLVIAQLRKCGVRRVIIAVGYLESLIRAYFGDGGKFGVEIVYSSEPEPLGTAGPLRLLREELGSETFLLLNGDVLADLDFTALINYHRDQDAAATIALSERTVDIDFGIVETDREGLFTGWREKPTLRYLVSMGIYVLEPKVIDHLPPGFVNVPDLIVRLHEDEQCVRGYKHEGFWLDIGRPEDYVRACHIVDEGGVKFL